MIPVTKPLTPPSEAQIKDTIQDLKKRLAEPEIKKPVNKRVREGYEECIVILMNGLDDYTGYTHLSSVQARSIAQIGIDYLRGEFTKAELLGVKLKQ